MTTITKKTTLISERKTLTLTGMQSGEAGKCTNADAFLVLTGDTSELTESMSFTETLTAEGHDPATRTGGVHYDTESGKWIYGISLWDYHYSGTFKIENEKYTGTAAYVYTA